jgi:hypothetical protein
LFPATILLTILAVTLTLLGLRDYSDVHKAAQQAISESSTATKSAADATAKGQEAETKAVEATKAIETATTKMNAQLNTVNQLASKVSGMESTTTNKIATANQHIEDRVTELDKRLEAAKTVIGEQQAKPQPIQYRSRRLSCIRPRGKP